MDIFVRNFPSPTDRNVRVTVLVKTNWQFFVVRGSYTYGLDLENTQDCIIAKLTESVSQARDNTEKAK